LGNLLQINLQFPNSAFPNYLMAVNKEAYHSIKLALDAKSVTLVAVSKTKPIEDIRELYDIGHRDFGENYVQELTAKAAQLPADIRWHFIGHLQSNKVKYIAPFVQLIHGVDSLRLLQEIDKQAAKLQRRIQCLLQVHIAEEETKFGFDASDTSGVSDALKTSDTLHASDVIGLMGMASFTDDMNKVRGEFRRLKTLFDQLKPGHPQLSMLSMGMSSDYRVAVDEGSTMVRIGSLLFGERVKPT
jgi:PLP dependent protein